MYSFVHCIERRFYAFGVLFEIERETHTESERERENDKKARKVNAQMDLFASIKWTKVRSDKWNSVVVFRRENKSTTMNEIAAPICDPTIE